MVHGQVSDHEHDRARVAYEAYAGDLGGVDPVNGAPLRDWDKVPTVTKRAFLAAIEAARTFDQRAEEADGEAEVDDRSDVDVPEQGAPADDDDLDGMTVNELRAVAAREQVTLPASATKPAIVARIREERARAAEEG